jgi:lipid-A-disaccharide synthase
VVELDLEKYHDPAFRTRHHIAPSAPILTLLPGSRRGEVSRLLPVFQETVLRLQQKYPALHVVIPTLPHLVEQIKRQFTIPATIVTTPSEKFATFQESQAALAASGTVSLELAAAGVPMVIAYKINSLTHFLLRRLVKVKYACLVNILMNQEVVPERLQGDCTPGKLASALENYFSKEEGAIFGRGRMVKQMQEAIEKLKPSVYRDTPSACAARQICRIMGAKSARS